MFKKIGNKLPDHHLLFFSSVLVVLFFILLFSPFYSNTTFKLEKAMVVAISPPPVINFTSPTTNDSIVASTSSITISGTITDTNDIITACSWKNLTTGDPGGSLGSCATWTVTPTNLVWGLNEIEFSATAGETSTRIMNYYRFPDDGRLIGYIWSENIGWISLSSLNCDPDEDGLSEGEGDCPASGVSIPNYNVVVDNESKNMSGYAWSENIGWISFEESESTPDSQAFNVDCYDDNDSSNDCTDSSGCTACYSPTQNGSGFGRFYGWGKILSLGDDGWLKLSSATSPTYSVDYNMNTGEITGYAWNGAGSAANEDFATGWVSFSCTNNSSCASSPYGASAGLNLAPTVSFNNMSYPGHCTPATACVIGNNCELEPELTWTYNDPEGFSQEEFQIIFDDSDHSLSSLDSLTDSTGTSLPLKTPRTISSVNHFTPSNNSYRNVGINYGTTYYAWIKVWDNYGADSGWVNLFADNTQMNFTTYKHQFPNPYFDYFTEEGSASAQEEIKFWDTSIYYSDSSGTIINTPGLPAECVVPGCSYSWTSSDAIPGSISDDDEATTTAKYPASGNQEMVLQVTDGDGYTCSTSTTININVKLPEWIEVR